MEEDEELSNILAQSALGGEGVGSDLLAALPQKLEDRGRALSIAHDSVSRQHAAIVHGAPTADGSSSVHVVDLKSTMGTHVDPFGRGEWNRLPPNTPTILPVGGRVRLGECTTLLVYPSAAPPPAAKPAPEPEDEAPRFASML